MRKIGVVGLGLMGTAITKRLLAYGYEVTIWNRSREKSVGLVALGANWAEDPFEYVDVVIVSLYSSDVVKEVLHTFSDKLRPGQLIVDTTTGEPKDSLALRDYLGTLGVDYLDAPISGSSQQTLDGEATILIAGRRELFDSHVSLWSMLAKNYFYCGDSGAASKMKLITNLVLGLNRAILAEGLAFAQANGVDLDATLTILKGSNAYSKAMDVKGLKMLQRDYSVQAKLSQHLKDVKLILNLAREHQCELPFASMHEQVLETCIDRGLGEFDNSAIFEFFCPKPNEQQHHSIKGDRA